MGLFDRFKRTSKHQVVNHRIWLTKEAKLEGIRAEISEALADPNGPAAVLLVAHFTDCAQALRHLILESESDGPKVFVAMAGNLEAKTPEVAELIGTHWVQVIVAERHPLPSHEEVVTTFVEALPCRCRIVFHASLDDSVMKMFAGDWVKQLLGRLGMSEDEAIESRMVCRRISQAQKTIAAHVTTERPADSCEDWFERNYPVR